MNHRDAWHRVLRAVLLTILAASVVVALQVFPFGYAHPDGDPWNYLAAGERLNAGHRLYALGPGDRPVVIAPPYWTVPLLAPPPIAVLWRPLALLGEPAMWLWGFVALAGVVGSAVFLGTRGALVLVAVLGLPLALTAISGNASASTLPALIGVWHWRDRPCDRRLPCGGHRGREANAIRPSPVDDRNRTLESTRCHRSRCPL